LKETLFSWPEKGQAPNAPLQITKETVYGENQVTYMSDKVDSSPFFSNLLNEKLAKSDDNSSSAYIEYQTWTPTTLPFLSIVSEHLFSP
jgi:hypothetical protein